MADGAKLETSEEKKSREKYRAYLDALPTYPEFALPTDDIDGLVPTAKVESWNSLLDVLKGEEFKKTKNDMIFRGHRVHNWQLASTLGRRFPGGAIDSDKSKMLMAQFELAMRGRGYDLTTLEHDEDTWAVGQHYGLATPLLDWTRSPFVALFFAFSKHESEAECSKNPSRAIFCMNMTKVREDLGTDAEGMFFEPKDHRNSRLVNQSGLFTVAPGGDDNLASYLIAALDEQDLLATSEEAHTIEGNLDPSASPDGTTQASITSVFESSDRQRAKELAAYLFKLHIPNSVEDRKDCLKTLRQMNIHNGSLFPDPSGASLYCNDWLDRLMEDEKVEKEQSKEDEKQKTFEEAVTTASAAGTEESIEGILEAYAEKDGLIVNNHDEIAGAIKSAAEAAMTIDWYLSESKRGRVRVAVRKALKAYSGDDLISANATAMINDIFAVFLNGAKGA